MRVFLDLEFIERGPMLPLQPISIGLVAQDGAEMYLINEECLSNAIRHPWISINVVPSLPIRQDIPGHNSISEWDRDHPEYQHVVSLDTFAQAVHTFLERTGPDLELWTYYGDYDHVVMCQLWGDMASLPPGIPMFNFDLQQVLAMRRRAGQLTPPLPPKQEVEHHALWDARWNAALYDILFPMLDAEVAELVEVVPELERAPAVEDLHI